jgi:hypothetical protein
MFVLLTSISQYISEIVLFSEYGILTGRLVNTKLLGFRLLWDVTVYVIDRQNCPTPNYCRNVTGHGPHITRLSTFMIPIYRTAKLDCNLKI